MSWVFVIRIVDGSTATHATTQSLNAWPRTSPRETDDSDAASRTLVRFRYRSTSGQLSGSFPLFQTLPTSAPELRSCCLLTYRPRIVRHSRVARRSSPPTGGQLSIATSRTTRVADGWLGLVLQRLALGTPASSRAAPPTRRLDLMEHRSAGHAVGRRPRPLPTPEPEGDRLDATDRERVAEAIPRASFRPPTRADRASGAVAASSARRRAILACARPPGDRAWGRLPPPPSLRHPDSGRRLCPTAPASGPVGPTGWRRPICRRAPGARRRCLPLAAPRSSAARPLRRRPSTGRPPPPPPRRRRVGRGPPPPAPLLGPAPDLGGVPPPSPGIVVAAAAAAAAEKVVAPPTVGWMRVV